MLVNSLLIQKKTTKSNVCGEEIIDLAQKVYSNPTDNISYKLIETTEMFKGRPDLIAVACYGNSIYGDFICKVNGISNPFELNEGQVLVIPQPTDLKYLITEEDWDDEIVEDESKFDCSDKKSSGTPKAKSEKRKPNEAVIGDERFNVNYGNRIVIY